MSGLAARLRRRPILIAPGVFDGLSAALAEAAGFEALYLSGASLAYTRLGLPDIGLVTQSELVDALGRIRERTDLPILVDADTGFGNALNVQRTIRLLERTGASAVQIEDQVTPKRCGHLAGKSLIPTGEMVGKIRAALDARTSPDLLIVARTDAIAVEGFDRAIERARAYAEAGADLLFVEAPRSLDELSAIPRRLEAGPPLVANIVEGGSTPALDAAALEALGYAVVIFPGGLVRALAETARAFFASLKAHGTTAPFRERMLDFQGLNALLGTQALLARARRYDPESGESERCSTP
ncbi:MAG: oxaloacetate decarboxylase [Geminicoccaceae bacterium]